MALVTGATGEIGGAIAGRLAERGYRLCLSGLGTEVQIAERIEAMRSRGAAQCVHIEADLRRPAQIESLVSGCMERFGAVDVLVNNAGMQWIGAVQRFDPERWDEVLAVNLSAAFHTTRLVVPGMLERGRGRIVNIASVHGLVASVDKCAYVAAKHGLVGLTKAVALELAQTPITCNAVCPGWVRTPLIEAQIEALAAREHVALEAAASMLLAQKQPSGRFVTAAQVADAVAFLCSDAAAEMRGSMLVIDGGWSAQ